MLHCLVAASIKEKKLLGAVIWTWDCAYLIMLSKIGFVFSVIFVKTKSN